MVYSYKNKGLRTQLQENFLGVNRLRKEVLYLAHSFQYPWWMPEKYIYVYSISLSQTMNSYKMIFNFDVPFNYIIPNFQSFVKI